MTGGTVSGQGSVRRLSRLIGGDSEFTCIVLGGTKSAAGSPEFIGPLREYLARRGIGVDLLSDFSLSYGHYAERFEELAGDCVLGVLILDITGPEELYQFGFLRGRGKFILALGKDSAGAWEAKGFRSDAGAETQGVPSAEAGTVSYCDKFIMSPLPGPVRTGWEAFSNENTEAEFLRCLGEALPRIIENYMEDSFGEEIYAGGEGIGSLREQAIGLSGYFSAGGGFGLTELDTFNDSLLAWEERTGRVVPSRVRSCLATLYSRLADTASDMEAMRAYVDRCASLYERILDCEKPGTLAGVTTKKLADLLVRRTSPEDGRDDLEKAVGLYRHALGIFSREVYPREFTSVSNNLGAALNSLYSSTGDPGYAREAVCALEGCLSERAFMNSENNLAFVNVNLGSAYASLALHENPRENYLKAAGVLEDALGLFGDPGENASVRASLGVIYKTLGDTEAESDNLDSAIEFYDRALLHYADEAAGGVHASNGRKLGEAFERLYRKGGDVTDLRKSIAAYSASLSAAADAGKECSGDIARILTSLYSELADTLERSGDYEGAIEGMKGLLSVFDPAASPLEYALAQVRMGGFYKSLAESEERELNTELAADSYKEALSLIDEETYYEMRKELRGLAGGLLAGLASDETDDMNKKIGFYMEALDYLYPDEHPREFARAQKGLGDVYMRFYLETRESGLPTLASQAFREVLRVFTREDYAEEYTEAEQALREAEGLIAVLERAATVASEGISGPDETLSERPFLTIVKDEEPVEDEATSQMSGEGQGPDYWQNTGPEDPEERAAHCEGMLSAVSKSDSPAEYARLKLLLGSAYSELGDRACDGKANYFRKALKACEESLGVYSTDDTTREYAGAAAAAAYSCMRIAEQTGDPRGYERALAYYGEALKALTAESAPDEWADVKESLGDLHRALAEIRGNPADYRKALAEYKDTLAVFTPEDRLQDYGRIEKNIGFIHGVLAGLEDSGPDYARAIEAFSGALRAYGPASSPAEYTEIHKLLGIALAGIARKENSHEHYRRAIDSWGKALGDAGPEMSPKDFALIMKNTGAAHESLYAFSGDPSDLRSAAASYEGALRYYTYKLMPSEYASITSALGAIYKRLAESEDAASNCRKAIKCCEGTLRVYTMNEYPLEYAATQNNIGIIYRTLAELEDKGRNSKRAINAYREALKVYTEKAHPAQYGSTKNNMGTAYMTLAEAEERVANCRMAVSAFEDALKVRTIQNYPLQFAATQNNLGVVYRMLSETEDKAKNCRKAIKAYENALIIYTIDRFPIQYATTQNNIGGACTTLAEEEDRTRNCDKAAEAYQEALKVFTRNSYPAQYGIVKSNLELLTEFSGKDVSSAAS